MQHNLDYITDAIGKVAQDAQLFQLRGNVLKVTGTLIRASVPNAKIGELFILSNPGSNETVKVGEYKSGAELRTEMQHKTDYEQWCVTERRRPFTELQRQDAVNYNDLMQWNAQVADLKQGLLDIEANIMKLEQERDRKKPTSSKPGNENTTTSSKSLNLPNWSGKNNMRPADNRNRPKTANWKISVLPKRSSDPDRPLLRRITLR